MSIVRYHRPHRSFNRVLDEIFNGDLSRTLGTENLRSHPRVNVIELEDHFRIELAAPGLNKEDFKLSVDKNLLTIKTEVKQDEEAKTEKYTRREFGYTQFERSFRLPKSVDQEQIQAKYDKGILNVSLAKKEEALVVKKEITIE